MRRLTQPGAATAPRMEAFDGNGGALSFALQPGLSLNDALTRPLIAAGWRCGTLRFAGAVLDPFSYVMPGPAPDASHVAYFSAPRTPAGATRVELANATFGFRDGAAFVHCHGAWTEPDGRRRGGHMLPHETVIADGCAVEAWGCADVEIRSEPDAETNFPLFRPVATPPPNPLPQGEGEFSRARTKLPLPLREGGGGRGEAASRLLIARIRPNEDICTAIETLCRTRGIRAATIRGSLGSLIGARFTDGVRVDDHATEVLVRAGTVVPAANGELSATLDMLVVDMRGHVHAGVLVRGDNPVCITFELALQPD